jgi:hypothetical protein
MKKPKKHVHETSYQFRIIWKKPSIIKRFHWKEYIKKKYFQLEVWRWIFFITMIMGIMLLDLTNLKSIGWNDIFNS